MQFLLSPCNLRQHVERTKDIHVIFVINNYLPTEICWRALRELWIFMKIMRIAKNQNFHIKILANWILAKFVAEKVQRKLQIWQKLQKLWELRKITIFKKFVAERKIIKIVAVFNPWHKYNFIVSSLLLLSQCSRYPTLTTFVPLQVPTKISFVFPRSLNVFFPTGILVFPVT